MNILSICGAGLSFVGTILIIFYIRTDHKEWVEGEEGQKLGERWYAVYVRYPRWLFVGMILIVMGFFLNIIGEIIR